MINIVEFKDVSMSFGSLKVLKNIDIEIEKGKFYTILGPSGCGKSTVLKLIGGFLEPKSGEIFINSKKVNDIPANHRQVNTVFQDYALFPHMNVYENIAFGLRIKNYKEDIIRKKVKKTLKLVNLSGFEKREISEMSGGQKQRVAIAMSILQNPKVILCDEISSSLDTDSEKEVFELLMKLKKTLNISIIIVSHNLAILKNFCDRVILMDKSKIRDIIIPVKPRENDYNKDYFNYLKEFLLND